MNEHKKTTDAQKRAKQKYMERFVEIKVRMTPERRSEVQAHAQSQHESTTAFINRAISETIERDTTAAGVSGSAVDIPLETPPDAVQTVSAPADIPPEKRKQTTAHAEARRETADVFIVHETIEQDNGTCGASQGASRGNADGA